MNTDASMLFLFVGSLGTALLGGWHCAGMCGPLALLSKSRMTTALYQFGRLLSYLALGAAAGYVGEHFLHHIPDEARWISGIILGLLALWVLLSSWKLGLFDRLRTFLWRNRPKGGPHLEFFSIGLLNGFLPCTWLYGFLILGAGLQDPLKSMVLMLSLWLGSLPWLLSVAFLGERLRSHFQGARSWAMPLLMVAVIFSLLAHHIHVHHHH